MKNFMIAYSIGLNFGTSLLKSNKIPKFNFKWIGAIFNSDSSQADQPSYTCDGHIEGEPSGNAAAEAEYIFCKNIVESFYWPLAERKIVEAINNTSITLPVTKNEAIAKSIKNMKSRLILPYPLSMA